MIYIVIGLPGTGKSSVAEFLAKEYNAEHLNADEFRQGLFKIDPSKKDQVFPEEWRDIPYRAIFLATRLLIKRNINVVIDAALYSNSLVSEARSIAPSSKVIQVVCPEDIAKKRLENRMHKSKMYVAGPHVYDFMKSITEEIKDVDFIVDTTKDWKSQLKDI